MRILVGTLAALRSLLADRSAAYDIGSVGTGAAWADPHPRASNSCHA